MVYKRYVKRDGKTFGPYYYKSYRDETGKTRTKLVSAPRKNTLKGINKFPVKFLSLIIIFSLFLAIGFVILSHNSEKDPDISSSSTENNQIKVDLKNSKILGSIIKLIGFQVSENEPPAENGEENLPNENSEEQAGVVEENSEQTSEAETPLPEETTEENIEINPLPEKTSGNISLQETNQAENTTKLNKTNDFQQNISEINQTETITNQTSPQISPKSITAQNHQQGWQDISEINQTLTENLTISETNQTIYGWNFTLNEKIIQYSAKLGEPVKWKKTLKIDAGENKIINNLEITLPKTAGEVSVKKILEDNSVEELEVNVKNEKIISETEPIITITGQSIKKNEKNNFFNNLKVTSKIFKFFRNFFTLVGRVTEVFENENEVLVNIQEELEDNDEIEIEYFTEAPYSEEIIFNDNYKKINIVGSEEIHYENILAFSNLSKEILSKNKINLYWLKNDSKELIDFNASDLNENGKIDYIEWIVPSLSNQTYELILITKAQHLDLNKNFISDIYDSVKELDGVWSEQINDSEYVRITFEKNLTNENDITIFPRTVSPRDDSGEPNETLRIEVYENNKSEIIAKFTNLINNEYNKVYLTKLNGTQNTFDLKILGGIVEFDHIIDPIILGNANSVNSNTTYENNFTHLNVSNSSIFYYYPFDDNVSATTVYDYTNNSNDGTISGAVYNSSGFYGGAYTFNGSGGKLSLADLTQAQPYSTSVWVYPTRTWASYSAIYAESDGLLGLFQRPDSLRYTFYYSSSDHIGNTSMNLNAWNHIVISVNISGNVNFYFNGVADGNFTGVPAGIKFHRIGSDDVGESFKGSIDEVMLWNTALTSTEALAIYNNQTTRFHGTGEMNYTGVNFAGNDTINITLAGCQRNMGSSLRAKVNNGAYVNFDSNCFIKDYNATGNLNSANVTVGFVGGNGTIANTFYTPLVLGNISLETTLNLVNPTPSGGGSGNNQEIIDLLSGFKINPTIMNIILNPGETKTECFIVTSTGTLSVNANLNVLGEIIPFTTLTNFVLQIPVQNSKSACAIFSADDFDIPKNYTGQIQVSAKEKKYINVNLEIKKKEKIGILPVGGTGLPITGPIGILPVGGTGLPITEPIGILPVGGTGLPITGPIGILPIYVIFVPYGGHIGILPIQEDAPLIPPVIFETFVKTVGFISLWILLLFLVVIYLAVRRFVKLQDQLSGYKSREEKLAIIERLKRDSLRKDVNVFEKIVDKGTIYLSEKALGKKEEKTAEPVQKTESKLIPSSMPAYAAERYKKASEFYSQADYSNALKEFQKAVEVNDKFWQAWQGIGSCYLAKGESEKAKKAFEKCLSINPKNEKLAEWMKRNRMK